MSQALVETGLASRNLDGRSEMFIRKINRKDCIITKKGSLVFWLIFSIIFPRFFIIQKYVLGFWWPFIQRATVIDLYCWLWAMSVSFQCLIMCMSLPIVFECLVRYFVAKVFRRINDCLQIMFHIYILLSPICILVQGKLQIAGMATVKRSSCSTSRSSTRMLGCSSRSLLQPQCYTCSFGKKRLVLLTGNLKGQLAIRSWRMMPE
jgi:hypothetical protein